MEFSVAAEVVYTEGCLTPGVLRLLPLHDGECKVLIATVR